MLSKLMAMTKAELKSKIQSIDVSAVKGRHLRRKFETIRSKKEGGFTLLELLVVVAILAAIAGTATVMLQDTDRKASAGAHVAMMDQLSKAINEYRTMNNAYPDNWDSLFQSATGTLATASPLSILSEDLAGTISDATADNPTFTGGSIAAQTLTTAEFGALRDAGITQVRVLNTAAVGDGYTCSASHDGLQAVINNKDNSVTAQNIFRPTAANGCGGATSATLADGSPVMVWAADGNKRVNAYNTGDTPVGATAALLVDDRLVAFGVGSDSSLFDPTKYGALSNSPIYRHVEPDEYNRFVVLFIVSGHGIQGGKAVFQAIVDGAGDTKDEELGELDNVRNT